MQNVSAERGLLSGVFNHGGEIYHDICDIVTTKSFSVETNKFIWACLDHVLKELPNGTIDLPTFMTAAKTLGHNEFFGQDKEMKHLRAIIDCPMMPVNARKMAGQIRKLEIARMLHGQLEVARANLADTTGEESFDKLIAMAEAPIFDLTSLLTNQATGGARRMGDGAEEYMRHLMDNPRDSIGIQTGMPNYDLAIGGGIRPNSMDVIVARLKTGKTFLVDNVALHIAGHENIPVFNVDTEMTWEEHLHRVCANLAGVNSHDIETGRVAKDPISKMAVIEGAKRLKDMPYHYECVIGREFEEILASMRRWVTRTVGLNADGKAKPCVIIYDYLKMMSASFTGGDMQEYQALGFIATALKNFMGRYGVGCLCFAQSNREGIDREDTGVIGGSDRIAQYATSATLFKVKSDEERAESDSKYTHKLVPLAGRHGAGLASGDYINLEAQYAQGRIIEGPTRDQLAKTKGLNNVQPVVPAKKGRGRRQPVEQQSGVEVIGL